VVKCKRCAGGIYIREWSKEKGKMVLLKCPLCHGTGRQPEYGIDGKRVKV